jgi:hypothetical protein
MEMNDQLHAPTSLPTAKESSISVEQESAAPSNSLHIVVKGKIALSAIKHQTFNAQLVIL